MTKISNLHIGIRVAPELWCSNMLPEGILECWLNPDGSLVDCGDPIATVRIEDSLHELAAPERGRLQTGLKANSVVEPGTVIGDIVRRVQA